MTVEYGNRVIILQFEHRRNEIIILKVVQLVKSHHGIQQQVRSIKLIHAVCLAIHILRKGCQFRLHGHALFLHIHFPSGSHQGAVIRFGNDGIYGGIEVHNRHFTLQTPAVQRHLKLWSLLLGGRHGTEKTVLISAAAQIKLISDIKQSHRGAESLTAHTTAAGNIDQIVVIPGFSSGIELVDIAEGVGMIPVNVQALYPLLHIIFRAFGQILVIVDLSQGNFTHTGRCSAGNRSKGDAQQQDQHHRHHDDRHEDLPEGLILGTNRDHNILPGRRQGLGTLGTDFPVLLHGGRTIGTAGTKLRTASGADNILLCHRSLALWTLHIGVVSPDQQVDDEADERRRQNGDQGPHHSIHSPAAGVPVHIDADQNRHKDDHRQQNQQWEDQNNITHRSTLLFWYRPQPARCRPWWTAQHKQSK